MMSGFIMEKWGLSFCSIIIDDIPGGWCIDARKRKNAMIKNVRDKKWQ